MTSSSLQLDSEGFETDMTIELGRMFMLRLASLYAHPTYRKVELIWFQNELYNAPKKEPVVIHQKEWTPEQADPNIQNWQPQKDSAFWEKAAGYFSNLYSLSRITRTGYFIPVMNWSRLVDNPSGTHHILETDYVTGAAVSYGLSYPHALMGLAVTVGFRRIHWYAEPYQLPQQAPNFNRVYALVKGDVEDQS